MMVPSRTPASVPESTKDTTTAMTVIEISKQTLVVPNSVFHVRTTARTNDSPGSMATLASTTQPASRLINLSG